MFSVLFLTRNKTITKLIYFNYMNTIAWNATTNTFADKHNITTWDMIYIAFSNKSLLITCEYEHLACYQKSLENVYCYFETIYIYLRYCINPELHAYTVKRTTRLTVRHRTSQYIFAGVCRSWPAAILSLNRWAIGWEYKQVFHFSGNLK